ncbi:MAG TPA: hypothetical protein VLS86_02365 [Acidimicrobiia bacterium]|nr:hypothetical protein [Acidimicrobiia bacterium]
MRLVLVFTIVYMVVLFGYGLAVASPLTNLYPGINLLVFAVFAVIHRWARFPLPVIWGIALVGLGNMIGGVILVDGQPLYVAPFIGPVPYDKFFHGAASFVMFFVAWAAMTRFAGAAPHFGGLVLFTFLATMGGGAVVEIAELIGSAAGGGRFNVGDYGNNALDLVSNAAGAAVGVIVLLVARRSLAPAAIEGEDG